MRSGRSGRASAGRTKALRAASEEPRRRRKRCPGWEAAGNLIPGHFLNGTRPGRGKQRSSGRGCARARYPPVPPRPGCGRRARGARAAAPSRRPAPAGRRGAGTRTPAATGAAGCASLAAVLSAAAAAARLPPGASHRPSRWLRLPPRCALPPPRRSLPPPPPPPSPPPRSSSERSAPRRRHRRLPRPQNPPLAPSSAHGSLPFSSPLRAPPPVAPSSRRAARDARDPPVRPYKARNRKRSRGGHGHRAAGGTGAASPGTGSGGESPGWAGARSGDRSGGGRESRETPPSAPLPVSLSRCLQPAPASLQTLAARTTGTSPPLDAEA